MRRSARLLLLLFLLAAGWNCMAQSRPYDSYRIISADDDLDSKWAEYLRAQLERRSDRSGILGNGSHFRTLEIVVDCNPVMQEDYSLCLRENRLTLQAKNSSVMLWTLYQTISWLAGFDDRIRAADLPPSILDPDHEATGSFTFSYRGIYSPTNNDVDFMAVNASHNVDYDWGLWGHNLRKTLGGVDDDSLYACHDGRRDRRQFCFSSDLLYRRLEDYILDNYGDGIRSATAGDVTCNRFCIMPDDNTVVCLCEECRRAGNTPQSATPAVVSLLGRLAARFPAHLFFTTAYLTTASAPAGKMPKNSGVIISAIDLPLRSGIGSSTRKQGFEKKIREWQAVTDRIYVWDYLRNFDDYLTPFPVLGVLEERLNLFHELGVSGVFYNGSGYDYASFDDMQTFVVASMLKIGDLDWRTLVKKYFEHFYPRSGRLICDYYLNLEKRVKDNMSRLEYYGGIGDAIDSFLEPMEFEIFRTRLDSIAKSTSGDERLRLNKLLTALNYTALELMRVPTGIPYDAEKAGVLLNDLEGHVAFPEMANYKEAGGSIDAYLEQWRKYGTRVRPPEGVLRHHAEFMQTAGNVSDPAILSDGICGFPSDYHTAWYQLEKGEVEAVMTFDHACLLTVRGGFLYAPKWKMELPSEFSVTVNGRESFKADFEPVTEPFSKLAPRIELHVSAGDVLKISIKPNRTPGSRMACDEIEIYEKK